MWEHFIEELLSGWAYLRLNPKEKRKLLEERDEKGEIKDSRIDDGERRG